MSAEIESNVEVAVRKRYSEGAQKRVDQLCCPIDYDPQYLKVIPEEILLRDYGCGDPSRFVREGDTVLDLGSGGGKICYIASQIFGEKGKVIGVIGTTTCSSWRGAIVPTETPSTLDM